MVDIHTHILPEIDDGSSSFEESIDMLELMIENGVTTVVATPHFNFENDNIEKFKDKRFKSISRLKALSTNKNLKIKILNGAELMFNSNLGNCNLDDFTIEGTDYLLIELSTRRNEPNLEYTLSAIIANGYIPILAHIERYSYLIKNSQRIVELIEMGVLMQVNAKSLHSKREYPFINKLMKNNLIHIIGSDAHDMVRRQPNLKVDTIPPEFIANQSKIIDNLPISVEHPRRMIYILGKYI